MILPISASPFDRGACVKSATIRLMSSDTGCMETHWATVWVPGKCAHVGCCQKADERLAVQLPQALDLYYKNRTIPWPCSSVSYSSTNTRTKPGSEHRE